MRFLLCLTFIVLLIPCNSDAQVTSTRINDDDYIEISRGKYERYDFVILMEHKSNKQQRSRKIYFDSAYTVLVSKAVLVNGKLSSAYEVYSNGSLRIQGNMMDGVFHGRFLWYENGRLRKKTNYNKGIPAGTWEEYDSNGKLIKKTTYSNDGKPIKDEKY